MINTGTIAAYIMDSNNRKNQNIIHWPMLNHYTSLIALQ